jgi:hypothetical protein
VQVTVTSACNSNDPLQEFGPWFKPVEFLVDGDMRVYTQACDKKALCQQWAF